MDRYLKIIGDAYYGYFNYLVNEIMYPSWGNYFWWLVGLSLFVWLLELIFPWRKGQPALRKDFWLDGFYMFLIFLILIDCFQRYL